MGLKVKHWSGWIDNLIDQPNELGEVWADKAKEARVLGNTLVIFEIPNNKQGRLNADAIEKIERLLQNEFK